MLNLQLLILSLSNMVEYKLKLSYQKVIGCGLLYGFFLEINSMVLGQPVDKLISCKVEVMSDILNLLEEDHKHLDLPYIGVQIGLKINSKKLMQSILIHQVP